MKPMNRKRKLSLKKLTITDLNDQRMRIVVAGKDACPSSDIDTCQNHAGSAAIVDTGGHCNGDKF